MQFMSWPYPSICLFVFDVTVTSGNLSLELFSILVPQLGCFAIEW